jgi:hypothetical protein
MTDNDRSVRFDSDLAAVLRETAGPGAPASLRYRLADVTVEVPPMKRPWFNLLRIATAATAAIALLVAGVLFLPRQSVGPSPSASPSPTAPASASPSTSPSPTPSPTEVPAAWSGLAWTDGVALGDERFISDIVPWGDGYVGVGGIGTATGLDTAFYTSTDGTHWTLGLRLTSAGSNVVAGRVARLGTTLLAIGEAFMDIPGAVPDFAPPLWLSHDGTTWTAVQSPTWNAAWASAWPVHLIAGPGGFVAVGTRADPVVAASSDGLTWTTATLPATERAVPRDAVATSVGFVVVGRDGQPDQLSEVPDPSASPFVIGRPAAWVSLDGVTWTETTVGGDRVEGAALSHVVAVRDGIIAIGTATTSDAFSLTSTSWFSTDGRTWSIVDGLRLPAGSGTYPAIAGDGDVAVVLGYVGGGSALSAWATTGASTWAPLASAWQTPVTACGDTQPCNSTFQGWLTPGGLIVAGTPGPITPQTFWFAAGG